MANGRNGSSGCGAAFGLVFGFGCICLIGTVVTVGWERGDYRPAIALGGFLILAAVIAGIALWVNLFGWKWPWSA
ncbi:hypothetical protein [Streptomyces fagopyri]